jgi:hypothetical protein
MSTDPQPFEEDLEAVEMQAAPDEAAEPLAEPGKKKKKKKEPKVKKPKAPKAPKPPKAPRVSSGGGLTLRGLFPDVYTSMLGMAVLALLVAILLLFLELWIGYGGELRAPKAMASPPAFQGASMVDAGGRLG